MILLLLLHYVLPVLGQADIPIYPITDVANGKGYFSDPYHVPYQNNQGIYISGTSPRYMLCGTALQPECATLESNIYNTSTALANQLPKGTCICSHAGIHPFQSGSVDPSGKDTRSWDAAVTLHINSCGSCGGISGWSVIVHASPANASEVALPPRHWIGDTLLVGSFSHNVKANYDGKYFRTPAGQLYLLYQAQKTENPHRDGIVAWKMDDPQTTAAPGQDAAWPKWLLLPDDDLNSEDYRPDNSSFRLVETGNVRAINGTFVMAYSVGAYNRETYKVGLAYADTFLGEYRKVMKANPDGLWGTSGPEAFYLLQSQERHDGWRYVGDQVLAPGVPTVAQIGGDGKWVLTFAGYEPGDVGAVDDGTYDASHRRPFFIDLDVNVPTGVSVAAARDSDLQSWITPIHGSG